MENDARFDQSSHRGIYRDVRRSVTHLTRLLSISLFLASLLTPCALFAHTSDQEALKVVQVAWPQTGEVRWFASDGTYEDYVTPNINNTEQEYAGRITLPSAATISSFGACMVNTGAFSEFASITLRLYADDYGKPADDPFFEAAGSITFPSGQSTCPYVFQSIQVPRTLWVSVVYNSFINGELKLEADTNGFGDKLMNRQGSYALWSDIWNINGASLFVAFPASGGGTDACVNDLSNGVVCLIDGRFEITGTWTGWSNPPTQPLIWTPVEDINATAGFQNNPSGIQIVMRVANGCSISGTWWIWLGGFTDAGWDITVRDTATGISKTYNRNRSGGNFPTTTRDMETFPCD